jgi:hypothetical protein
MINISSDGISLEVPRAFVVGAKRLLPDSKIVYVQEYPTAARDKIAEYPY